MDDMMTPDTCEWNNIEPRGLDMGWHTQCNEVFYVEVNGPIESGFTYCPCCGRRILDVHREETSNEEERR